MTLPRPPSGRGRGRPLRGYSGSEKMMDGTGSWDTLDWTKLDSVSGSGSFANLSCLLESEKVVVEGYGVVLINTDEAGTLLVTNFHGSFTLSNELWRISDLNSNYNLCQTHPFAFMVPKSISDEELLQACSFRARCRLPVITWCQPGSGAVIARSSQPLVGLMMNMRSSFDEKLAAAFCSQLADAKRERRKLYIADARPRKNALANVAMGGGSESSSNYFQSEIVFFGIDTIHAMRESCSRLRDYLDMHGTTSSDGRSCS